MMDSHSMDDILKEIEHLSKDEIQDCFNQEKYLENIDVIFDRFFD